MKPKVYGIDAFRAAAKDGGQVESDARVRVGLNATVKAGEGDSRVLTFTISTESVDRMGDTIAVDGWELAAYRKNPVVLWAHDSSSLPVAKAPKVWTEKLALKADAEFTPPGMARFNDTVFDMYKQGFLSATSVGFVPLKYAFTDDPQRRFGIDFLKQELLEFSCVPVPANADALVEGRAAGIDLEPLLDWAEQTLRADDERVLRLADSVLGAGEQSQRDIAWAKRIAANAGLGLYSPERIDSVERAARAQRLAEKKRLQQSIFTVRAPR